MEAVREAYADIRDTAEAAQAQLSELQAAEKGLQKQLSACAQQVNPYCVKRALLIVSNVSAAAHSIHCLLADVLSDIAQPMVPRSCQLRDGCELRAGR